RSHIPISHDLLQRIRGLPRPANRQAAAEESLHPDPRAREGHRARPGRHGRGAQPRGPHQRRGGSMRLSREKLNKLAASSTEQLASLKNVEFLEGYDDIRQEVRRILEDLLAGEERLDKAARCKIESQRRRIPEGTPEWNILYHKYYNEEVKKLGI